MNVSRKMKRLAIVDTYKRGAIGALLRSISELYIVGNHMIVPREKLNSYDNEYAKPAHIVDYYSCIVAGCIQECQNAKFAGVLEALNGFFDEVYLLHNLNCCMSEWHVYHKCKIALEGAKREFWKEVIAMYEECKIKLDELT